MIFLYLRAISFNDFFTFSDIHQAIIDSYAEQARQLNATFRAQFAHFIDSSEEAHQESIESLDLRINSNETEELLDLNWDEPEPDMKYEQDGNVNNFLDHVGPIAEENVYQLMLLLQTRHGLTDAAISDLARLLNLIFKSSQLNLCLNTAYKTIVKKGQSFAPNVNKFFFTRMGHAE
jgi:hypothetical protein